MKRFMVLIAALLVAVCSAAGAEGKALIRQDDDLTFVGGTMMSLESYPEAVLITYKPEFGSKYSPPTNTVRFPLPENAFPDEYAFNNAQLIDRASPDGRINYVYKLHEDTSLDKMMKQVSDQWIRILDKPTEKVFLNMGGSVGIAYLYLKQVQSVLEIRYRVLDYDAYTDDEMKDVLTAGILGEKDRVLSGISYECTREDGWWTLGKYFGVSMLDGYSEDYRVNIVFPELSITNDDGTTMTARMYPHAVGHDCVDTYLCFSEDVGIDIEFKIDDLNPTAANKLKEGSADAMALSLADGKEWAAYLYGWSENQSSELIYLARQLHTHGGLHGKDPVYLNVKIDTKRFSFNSLDALTDFLNALVVNVSDGKADEALAEMEETAKRINEAETQAPEEKTAAEEEALRAAEDQKLAEEAAMLAAEEERIREEKDLRAEEDRKRAEEEAARLAAEEEQKKAEDTAWTCPECGHEGNSGNFCSNCGAGRPEPETDLFWNCPACGREGNDGNFCSNCGAKRPEKEWTCPDCGHEGNDGNFCSNCGKPRP